MPNPNILFPILRRLQVKGHALFPGQDGKGIDHSFERGITVVAGINGIGKTTILNLIFRMLVGPFDPFKADEGVQLTQTRLHPISEFDYFSRRDRSTSESAAASAEFEFGEHILFVTRNMHSLSITAITIDGQTPSVKSGNKEDAIWKLSGCGSQYDFHLLIRSLVFFLEEKMPVVWDPISQAELFRILFLNSDEAIELARLASDIQRIDSQRRNLVHQLNRYKSQIPRRIADPSAVVEASERVAELSLRIEVIDRQLESLTNSADNLLHTRESECQKLDSLKLELEEATRAMEHMYSLYFASLYPRMPDIARNVFLNLLGDSGCLVCGSRALGISERYKKLTESGVCPVCGSPKEEQEQLPQANEFTSVRIEAEKNKISVLKQSVNALDNSVEQLSEKYQIVLKERITLQQEKIELQQTAKQFKLLLPISTDEQIRTENYINVSERAISDYEASIRSKMDDYQKRMLSFRSEINSLRTNLTSYFSDYAASFLAETCKLTYSPKKLQLGQAVEKIEYPTFSVVMTSAVSPASGTTRTRFDDVSESQKEFIDLAFRMAILKAYASSVGRTCFAMIVIETPESSLDSIFIANAGKMLRTWCAPDSSGGSNKIIASSNLNRENMIQALLGLGPDDLPHPTAEEVQRHVINLLKLAAENAALRKYRDVYEASFNASTTPGGVDA
jgi:archaellum component FlaC